MRILITGASGFIGRNLVEYLGAKFECLAPSHRELELMDEAAVTGFFAANRFDAVIHAASVPVSRKIKDPQGVALGNLKMFFNIAANSASFSKLIFLSSGAEYDRREAIAGVTEADSERRIPEDELGFSKYVCTKYIRETERMVSLRLFGVFGKYEDYQIRFISNAICKAIYGLPITIKQNRFFSYLFVEDLCRAVEYFLAHEARSKVYNVAPAEHIDLLSIAQKVNELSGKNLQIRVGTPGLGKEYTADNALFTAETGGFRFTPPDEAIQRLYRWYEENKQVIDPELLKYDP